MKYDGREISLPDSVSLTHVIFGEMIAIAIMPRGSNDPHACFALLSEDDELWHPYNATRVLENGVKLFEGTTSSHWLADLASVTAEAEAWMKKNARPSKNGYGYDLKPRKKGARR